VLSLALRIILHQPVRYLVALLGISVAAGLAFIQLGLYMGFKRNASVIVDNTDGDIWVCAQFQENFDFPKILAPRVLETVKSTRGVASAHPMLIVFTKWRLKTGAEKTVQVVGYDVKSGVGEPWNLLTGFRDELAYPGNVTVDTTAARKLDEAAVGDSTEIGFVKARVAGVTDGIRSFQGNPMVFTDLNNARSFGHLRPDAVHYVIVKVEPGANVNEVLRSLRETGSTGYFEAYPRAEFSRKAQDYWLNSTGAGPALGLAALMGLIVGVVVAGQVLYTSTLEHIKEYGTLKAMGATNAQVSLTIVAQAVMGALPAHIIAGGLLLIAQRFIGGKGIHLSLDPQLYWMLGGGTVMVCIAASMLSVWRVTCVEPAEVFRG
jgi:putative ABC transport system permease protein